MLQVLGGPKGCFETVGDFDFFVDIVKVGLYRMGTDVQVGGNLYVLGPCGNHTKDLALSSGQVYCIGSRKPTSAFIFQNKFGHNLPGKPQLTVENRLNPFQKVIKGITFVKKPVDSL